MEIWEPKPPGTLWATPALLRGSFTFYPELGRLVLRRTALTPFVPYCKYCNGYTATTLWFGGLSVENCKHRLKAAITIGDILYWMAYLRPSVFWDTTQRRLVVTDVSGQP